MNSLPIEKSYGVVVVLRRAGEPNRFLLLHQLTGNWSFPKGHAEGNESPKEAALRELFEETGIKDITLLDTPLIEETYTFMRDGVLTQKINQYFAGVVESDRVCTQPAEIDDYKWATYEEAMGTFTYENGKEILRKVRKLLI